MTYEIVSFELRRGCAEVLGSFPTLAAARDAAERQVPDPRRPLYLMQRERYPRGCEEIRHVI